MSNEQVVANSPNHGYANNLSIYVGDKIETALKLMYRKRHLDPDRFGPHHLSFTPCMAVRSPILPFPSTDKSAYLLDDLSLNARHPIYIGPHPDYRKEEANVALQHEEEDLLKQYNITAFNNGGLYYLLDLDNACIYLLNIFISLTNNREDSAIGFDDDSIKNLYTMMYELIMFNSCCTKDTINPVITDKLIALLGKEYQQLTTKELLSHYAKHGADSILSKVLYNPYHFSDMHYLPCKLAFYDAYTSTYTQPGKRFEMEKVYERVRVGSGVFQSSRQKGFYVPKTVALIHAQVSALNSQEKASYHDLLQYIGRAKQACADYKIGRHFLHEYQSYDASHIIKELEDIAAKYNPVTDDLKKELSAINARLSLDIGTESLDGFDEPLKQKVLGLVLQ